MSLPIFFKAKKKKKKSTSRVCGAPLRLGKNKSEIDNHKPKKNGTCVEKKKRESRDGRIEKMVRRDIMEERDVIQPFESKKNLRRCG